MAVQVQGEELVISLPEEQTEICRHPIPVGTGQKIQKSDHKRDKTGSIDERIVKAARLFAREEMALSWMGMLREEKLRYIRDQLDMIQRYRRGGSPKGGPYAGILP